MDTNATKHINDGFSVKRRIKLNGINAQNVHPILQALEKLRGVRWAKIDDESGLLTLAYNNSKQNISQIELVLKSNGTSFARDWWTRFKLGWYRNMDTNAKDNAQVEIHCCNKPPK